MEDAGLSLDDTMSFLDLAALGTVADVVPLTGDNRIIVKEGLRYIQKADRPAIKSLRQVCGLNERDIKAGLLSFTIVPRINAAGRVADSSDVVRLLLSDSAEEAMELSEWLNRLNSERQQIEEDVYQEALVKLNTSEIGPVIVLSGDGWHQGVLGIVASRIAEEFCRPTFILSVQDGVAKGSARSVPSFDICRGLAGCGGLLLSFGGHKQAAGLKLEALKVPDFRKMMGDIIKQTTGDKASVPIVEIDTDIKFQEVTHALINELSMLEPLGHGNAEPVFGSKNLYVVDPRIVGRNHLKMKLKKNTHLIDAIGFDMGLQLDKLNLPSAVDAAFTPAVNEWNGRKYLQLILKAVRPAV
jgi:single-stranded-DNA-specific exonuclease